MTIPAVSLSRLAELPNNIQLNTQTGNNNKNAEEPNKQNDPLEIATENLEQLLHESQTGRDNPNETNVNQDSNNIDNELTIITTREVTEETRVTEVTEGLLQIENHTRDTKIEELEVKLAKEKSE